MAQASIPVRYEKHDGGGSVWVRTVDEFLDDYWLCIYSTAPGQVGRAVSAVFNDAEAGPIIPVPDWT